MKKSSISIKKILNPVSIYILIWVFMIALYSLKIVDYGDVSNNFNLAIIISLIGIIFGNAFANVIILNKYKYKKCISEVNLPRERDIVIIYKVLCYMGIIGVILAFIKVFSQVSLSTFFLNQATIKTHLSRSTLAAYLSSAAYSAIPISVILERYYRYNKTYVIIPFIISCLYALSFWSRFQVAIAAVLLLSSYILIYSVDLKKKISLFKLSIFGFISFTIFFIFMCWTIEMRVSEYGDLYNPYDNLGTNDIIYPILISISPIFGSFRAIQMTYAYFVASIPTLDYWVSGNSPYGMGQVTFPYIYRLLEKLGIAEQTIVGDIVLGNGMQLPSFIGYAYMDFGLFGIFIYTFLLGMIATYIYIQFIKTKNVLLIGYLASIYALIFVSVQTNILAETMYIIIIFIIFITNIFLKKSIIKNKNERGKGCIK